MNENCPLCERPGVFLSFGVIAPWISLLVKPSEKLTKFGYCQDCTLKFFYYRYSEDEVINLYSSYRTGEYLRHRRSWEFWYGASENDAYNPVKNADKVNVRRQLMQKMFSMAGISGKSKVCVDFGGDLGQFFPDFAVGKKYLIDVSANSSKTIDFDIVPTIDDIEEPIDLILNCGVMEHISELKSSVRALGEKLMPTGVMYVEVPLDDFRVSLFHKTKLYRYYLSILLKVKPIFIAVDFITGVIRLYTRRIPFFGIVKQSEHINYFNSRSLLVLSKLISDDIWISPEDSKFKQGKLRLGHLAAIITK